MTKHPYIRYLIHDFLLASRFDEQGIPSHGNFLLKFQGHSFAFSLVPPNPSQDALPFVDV